jgi:hypothetical protein
MYWKCIFLKNEKLFMSIISHIRLDMKVKMTDNRVNQPIQYPNVSFSYFI